MIMIIIVIVDDENPGFRFVYFSEPVENKTVGTRIHVFPVSYIYLPSHICTIVIISK